jgi:plastocyanin
LKARPVQRVATMHRQLTTIRPAALGLVYALGCASTGHGQRLIERTPGLPNSVNAATGMVEAYMTHRFTRAAGVDGITMASTFDLAAGLPFLLPLHWSSGVRFAPATFASGSDEWEIYERFGVLEQATGAYVDLMVTGAYNFAAHSVDGEVAFSRRLGAIRVIGAGRALSAPYAGASARFAVAAGAAWHIAPRHSPVTLAADVAMLTDRAAGERVAWNAAVQTGLPHTALSLSLQAGNALSTTLEGASLGTGHTRFGFELNAPVELLGFVTGWFTARERAISSVSGAVDAAPAVRVSMWGYLYAPGTIRIRAGETVEWINDDAVVHTVTAENGAFDSRGIQPGGTWRARFDEAGIYPYYCGPHPFMKGVVVVD